MAKPKIQYECSACGHVSPKWLGLCPACGEWHTFEEKISEKKKSSKKHKVDISNSDESDAVALKDVKQSKDEKISTNLSEFDRVLGGGLIDGSFLLLGGDPGIGKSTLMLQVAQKCPNLKILYIAGEESASQIKQRADRIGMNGENLLIYNNTDVQNVISQARKIKPDLLVVDSIQTVFSSELSSLPGSVQQIRECSAMFQQIAKKEGITTLMIGHVTKEGDIAGPRILEHMVDTVLHFEGDQSQLHRLLRGVKNRFGPANEVGVFEMRDTGLHEVNNPSDLFLAEMNSTVSGNCVTCVMEGSRPILIEIQALVTPSNYSTPQRTASGFDQRRLSLLIAVLEKRAAMSFAGQDVYLNVAGGLKINDTAADLAVVAALASSLKDEPVPEKSLYIGEVGLGGEVRRVPFLKQRLNEAEKMGFKNAVLPISDTAGTYNMTLNPADHLMKALK
ncbi:DNA repair protein RadA [Rhodohalobacter barkolensis]|uniref:DNA repair protein RadA n=1 Tax=Rhodohalobacter barkolensis TaxID=2053187 RepID=A0A2N0VFD2_9BACT|nr:DNA repair protein RadA [Rhodohalobacter barkolensis]PKD42892.1 DNA repair protein RadA [Rhodohalobacter barkolensis]